MSFQSTKVVTRIVFLIARSACCALIAAHFYRCFGIIVNSTSRIPRCFSARWRICRWPDSQKRPSRYAFGCVIRSRRGRFPLSRGLIVIPLRCRNIIRRVPPPPPTKSSDSLKDRSLISFSLSRALHRLVSRLAMVSAAIHRENRTLALWSPTRSHKVAQPSCIHTPYAAVCMRACVRRRWTISGHESISRGEIPGIQNCANVTTTAGFSSRVRYLFLTYRGEI